MVAVWWLSTRSKKRRQHMRNDICGPACTGQLVGHAEVLDVIGGRPGRSNRTATSAMVVAGWAVSDERG